MEASAAALTVHPLLAVCSYRSDKEDYSSSMRRTASASDSCVLASIHASTLRQANGMPAANVRATSPQSPAVMSFASASTYSPPFCVAILL